MSNSRQKLQDMLGFLIGKWSGSGENPEGKYKVELDFSWKMDCFLFMEAIYIKGETTILKEEAIFSIDKTLGSTLMGRWLNSEGYIEECVGDSHNGEYVFRMARGENFPEGLRLRRIWTIRSDSEIHVTLELASEGEQFAPYAQTFLKKVLEQDNSRN
ncbi:MAG: hypothetical protein ACFFB3_21830 [Candidatus Hodarchaeota archaeon]